MADRLLLTIGGCAANVAVDLVKMGVPAAVVGRVGGDVFGRVVADLLREHGVDVSALQVSPEADTSQTLIVNVAGQDRRFIHTFGANADFRAADIPLERVGPLPGALPGRLPAHAERPRRRSWSPCSPPPARPGVRPSWTW